MKIKQIIANLFLIGFLLCVTQTAFAQLTWDGGGATNNWSDATNWSTDTVPLNNQTVTFDGTSTKDVTFDITLTRAAATNINTGYTGTLSAGSTNLTFAAFTQNDGTFNGGSGILNFTAAFSKTAGAFNGGGGNITFGGTFTHSSGTFNGGSGTLDFNGNFTLSGGTFIQSSNLNRFSSSTFTVNSTAVFNHNNGTFVIDGSLNFSGSASPIEFFNLRLEADHNFGATSVIVNETLEFVSGNTAGGSVETRKGLVISPTYSGNSNVLISGSNTRTISLPVTANMPRLTINAPNVTIEPSSPSGTLTFASIAFLLQSGTFNANGANVTFNAQFTQSGGTFNGGSGTLDFNSNFTLSGGTFTQSSNLNRFSSPTFIVNSAAVFNHNNGTFVIDGSLNFSGSAATINFHNFTCAADCNLGVTTITTSGLLNFQSGLATGNGTYQVSGDIQVNAGYTGSNEIVQIIGTGNQTYSNTGGTNPRGAWTINKPSGTLNLTSNLDLSNGASNLVLTNGTITTGANIVIAGTRNITRTNGFINGNLRRTFNFATSKIFHVGTINGFAPVTVNATAGTFVASTTFTVGGNNGTMAGSSPTQSLTRNWTLEPSVGGITSADIRFDYLQTDVPSGANEASFTFLRKNGSTVTPFTPTSIDTTANFATLNGVTSFSDWSLGVLAPLASTATISGRVLSDSGRGISKARLTLTDSNGNSRIVMTNPFGYYRFNDVESGRNYVVSVIHKRYEFPNPNQVIFVNENLTDVDFTALNQASGNSKLQISGYVKNAKGNGLVDVSVEISGGSFTKKLTVKTDNEGFYSFDDLTVGETYFINIKSKIHSFSNPSRVFTVSEDLTDADFVSDSK